MLIWSISFREEWFIKNFIEIGADVGKERSVYLSVMLQQIGAYL